MFDSIVNKIPADTLIDIYSHPKTNLSGVMRRLNSHFATIAKIVDFLMYHKIIKSSKIERNRNVELTRKGKAIARNIIAIKKLLLG